MRKGSEKIIISPVVAPAAIWLTCFLMLPLGYVIFISFMSKSPYGGIVFSPSVSSYTKLLSLSYLKVFIKSFVLAFNVAALCIILGYPFAMIISRSGRRTKPLLVTLLMLPFWVNSMIRIYGWNTLLRTKGVINTILLNLNIINSPLSMLYTDGAVRLGMVYDLLPFAVLPMYSAIEKIDPSLIEASGDLGAGTLRTFMRVTLPLSASGIVAASLQTFIPALGLFYISDMMGGAKTMYIGNLIKNQFLSARNWPLGASLSIVLIIITLILVGAYSRIGNMEDMV